MLGYPLVACSEAHPLAKASVHMSPHIVSSTLIFRKQSILISNNFYIHIIVCTNMDNIWECILYPYVRNCKYVCIYILYYVYIYIICIYIYHICTDCNSSPIQADSGCVRRCQAHSRRPKLALSAQLWHKLFHLRCDAG